MSNNDKKVRAPKREREESEDDWYRRCFEAEGVDKPYSEWTVANLQRKCKFHKLVYSSSNKKELIKRIEDHETGRFSDISRSASVKLDPKSLVHIEPKRCVLYDWHQGENTTVENIPMDIWKHVFMFCRLRGEEKRFLSQLLNWRIVCKYFHRILTQFLQRYAFDTFGNVVNDLELVVFYVFTYTPNTKQYVSRYRTMFNQCGVTKSQFKYLRELHGSKIRLHMSKHVVTCAAKTYGSAQGIREKLRLIDKHRESSKFKATAKKELETQRTTELNDLLQSRGLGCQVDLYFGSSFSIICTFFERILKIFLHEHVYDYVKRGFSKEYVIELFQTLTPSVQIISEFYHERLCVDISDENKAIFKELYETHRNNKALTIEDTCIFVKARFHPQGGVFPFFDNYQKILNIF
jgi:hypothetical protein